MKNNPGGIDSRLDTAEVDGMDRTKRVYNMKHKRKDIMGERWRRDFPGAPREAH